MNNFDKWFDVPHEINEQHFKEQFECTFEPDPRIVELERRFTVCHNNEHLTDSQYTYAWREEIRRARQSGYTNEEISRAKRHVSSLR
tara:strand:- start:2754 stop:3014 length:261 start_codon:yes stop_codon:yes gene_type:complete